MSAPTDPPSPAAPAGASARGGSTARVWAAVALVAVAAGVAVLAMRRGDERAPPPALYTIERDGWRYEYHAVAGTEALFDLSKTGGEQRNLVRDEAARVEGFREELRRKTGVKDLEELRAPHRELYEHLKSLGYL